MSCAWPSANGLGSGKDTPRMDVNTNAHSLRELVARPSCCLGLGHLQLVFSQGVNTSTPRVPEWCIWGNPTPFVGGHGALEHAKAFLKLR